MQTLLCTRVHNGAKFGGLIVSSNGQNQITLTQFSTPKDVDPDNPNMFFLGSADTDFNLTKDVLCLWY